MQWLEINESINPLLILLRHGGESSSWLHSNDRCCGSASACRKEEKAARLRFPCVFRRDMWTAPKSALATDDVVEVMLDTHLMRKVNIHALAISFIWIVHATTISLWKWLVALMISMVDINSNRLQCNYALEKLFSPWLAEAVCEQGCRMWVAPSHAASEERNSLVSYRNGVDNAGDYLYNAG